MFTDLLHAPSNTEIETDLCIIGAGAAGITIARAVAHRNFGVVLLESGGLRPEADTQALSRGESVGLPYCALDETRQRYFGGSTNVGCWGGWCRPLCPLDFDYRPWVPHSGWPLTRAQLDPWYKLAQEVCEAGPFDYDLESWRERTGAPLDELSFECKKIISQLAQMSPPTRFGRRYREELAASTNVRVYLHANATEIETDSDNSTATKVAATTLGGRRLSVACRYVVLAAGGIENARLLLLSNRVGSRGLGNDHDLVGRFFMDHPSLDLGSIEFSDGHLPELYDTFLKHHGRSKVRTGVVDESLIAASLSISPDAQRSEKLLNYHAWMLPRYVGDGSASSEALKRLYNGIRTRELPHDVRGDLKSLLRRPDHAASSALGRLVRPKVLVRDYRLVNILEPEPVPESRVTLGDALDPLGLPRVRLDWRVGGLVRRTLASAHELLGEELRRSGIAKLRDPFLVEQEDRFLGALGWVWHNMGTTRMHSDPAGGVVDADCRVHSTSNVYVAGSSVFATPGNDMPTLTIVALALRLAEHLAQRLEMPVLSCPESVIRVQ